MSEHSSPCTGRTLGEDEVGLICSSVKGGDGGENETEFTLIDDSILSLSNEVAAADGSILGTYCSSPTHLRCSDVSADGSNATVSPACMYCRTCSNLEPSLLAIGHFVCRSCLSQRRDTHSYRCVSQGRALRKFGLTLQELRSNSVNPRGSGDQQSVVMPNPLVVKDIPNPRGFGTPMKLYYEFQLIAMSIAKYGSLEAAAQEIDAKEEERFARMLGKPTAPSALPNKVHHRHSASSIKAKKAAKVALSRPPAEKADFTLCHAHKTLSPRLKDPLPSAHTDGSVKVTASLNGSSSWSLRDVPANYWTNLAALQRDLSSVASDESHPICSPDPPSTTPTKAKRQRTQPSNKKRPSL